MSDMPPLDEVKAAAERECRDFDNIRAAGGDSTGCDNFDSRTVELLARFALAVLDAPRQRTLIAELCGYEACFQSGDVVGKPEDYLIVDSLGRECGTLPGLERAKKERALPVKVYALGTPGMSADRLKEIQRLASCSHRGEWKYRKGVGVGVDEYADDEDDAEWDGLVVGDGTSEVDWIDVLQNCTDMNESDIAGVAHALSEGEHFIAERDGAFIADARQAVPELLAEVLRLRAACAAVVADYDAAAGEKYDELSWEAFGGVDPLRTS